jgi:hypothetical protein
MRAELVRRVLMPFDRLRAHFEELRTHEGTGISQLTARLPTDPAR